MKKMIYGGVLAGIVLLAAMGCSGKSSRTVSAAEGYPSKNIEMIIPFGAGGGNDIIGRAIAAELEKKWGNKIVVVNKPSNMGIAGLTEVAKARPDGYTMTCVSDNEMSILFTTRQDLEFAFDDLKYVGGLNTIAMILVASQASGIKSVRDLKEKALANPGQITCSISGSTHLLLAVLMMKEMGIKVTTVTRQSANETANALMGNHSDIGIITSRFRDQLDEAGGKTIAVFARERFPVCADVPTMIEQGVNVAGDSVRLVAVPGKTPDEITAVIEQAIKETVESESYQKILAGLNEVPKFTSGKDLAESIRSFSEAVKIVAEENPGAFD